MKRLPRAILRAASLVAPRADREEWLAEWSSELWYVRSHRQAIAFALGSIPDAWCLRRRSPRVQFGGLQSPVHCLLVLSALAAAAIAPAFRLPGVRYAILPPPLPPDVVMIWRGRAGVLIPTISADDYRTLVRAAPMFDEVAFYRVARGRRDGRTVSIAYASRNFHRVLGSSAAAPVLPGHPDLVLPDDERGSGFALARVAKAQWTNAGIWNRFEYAPVPAGQTVFGHILIIVVAILLVSTSTSLRLGEYPRSPGRARRALFLAAKIALLIPIVICGTLDIVSPDAGSVGFLIGFIFAFRWALIDQRRRCPVCLRLLGNPTRIGEASHTFLEWYGTELICRRGHGMMHVPEIPSSCLSTQRWHALDPSWSSLFS